MAVTRQPLADDSWRGRSMKSRSVYLQILLSTPANFIPAIVAVAMVYSYTRLIGPGQFGLYSLVFSFVLLAQTTIFTPIQFFIIRFLPAALKENDADGFIRSVGQIRLVVSGSIAVIGVLALLLFRGTSQVATEVALGAALLITRGLEQNNQAFNRSANRLGRYNLVECLHSLGGYAIGMALVVYLGRRFENILLGLIIAAALSSVIDIPTQMASFWRGRTSSTLLRRAGAFSIPITLAYLTSSLLQYADRLTLGSVGSASALGIYAVAYSLVERPTSLLSSAIASSGFPEAVRILETEGLEASRKQVGLNAAILLGVMLPACIGLALMATPIATVMVGQEFRSGVTAMLPLLSLIVFMRALSAHFVDHAYYLTGRFGLALSVYAPASLGNVALSALLVPYWGIYGAAWSGLVCQALQTLVSGFVAHRIFRFWLPREEIAKIGACVLPMVILLSVAHFRADGLGLMAAVGTGALVYGLSVLSLNVLDMRSKLTRRLSRLV